MTTENPCLHASLGQRFDSIELAEQPGTAGKPATKFRRLPGQTFRLSPAVDKLLKLIHQEIKIFPPLVRLRHDSLDIEIPEGALHFPSVEVFPERDWGSLVMRMEVHGTRVEAACTLREFSDVSTTELVETLWDMQEGESAYKIVNASLCLGDARQFVAYLVSAFFPWTLNVRSIEHDASVEGNTGQPATFRTATEQSAVALLAAFAVEHPDAFENYCAGHGEDADSLLQWRIVDWADAYRSDDPGLRAQPADPVPLFRIGPEGSPQPDPQWAGAVADLCEAVRVAVGGHPDALCWPYRFDGDVLVAFDADGEAGSVNLTIVQGGTVELPLDGKKLAVSDICVVADAADAFYLGATLLEALGLPSSVGGMLAAGARP